MIVTFTDFGLEGPYLGQVRIELARRAPGIPVIDLMADAPRCDPRSSAYLLSALVARLPRDVVILGVVDPGVGTDRHPVVVRAEGRWFVGPDNGLFERAALDRPGARMWRIVWRPPRLSKSFHGRDLFAPVAARLALGEPVGASWLQAAEPFRRDWPHDLNQVIYVDHFGNCVSGIRGSMVSDQDSLVVDGHRLSRAETFADAAPGDAFWFRNSMGLAEVAVNAGSAAQQFDLSIGSQLAIVAAGAGVSGD